VHNETHLQCGILLGLRYRSYPTYNQQALNPTYTGMLN